MAAKGRRGFIWPPRKQILTHDIKVNTESVKLDNINAEFTKGVCPEVGEFKIRLLNTDQKYSTRYKIGQTVQLTMDFFSGTTLRFEGTIDRLMNHFDPLLGYVLDIYGAQLATKLLDINVTTSFEGATINDILSDLVTNFAPSGFTINFTSTATNTPKINWEDKPFWDCVNDLGKVAEPTADSYVSDTKVIQFFDKNSVENNNEAFVHNDTMIQVSGFGQQILTTRNKIKVRGDDGTGLPILFESNNFTSQSDFGIKEQILNESSIRTNAEAIAAGNAERDFQATPEDEGEGVSLILPSVNPGDRIHVTSPTMKILGQKRLYKFTHFLPRRTSELLFGNERKLKQILKNRIKTELALENNVNPFGMRYSLNLTFNQSSELDSFDTNVQFIDGKVSLVSGTQGRFTKSHTSPVDVTEIHTKAVGSQVVGTTIEVSLKGGQAGSYQTLTLEKRTELIGTGKSLLFRVTIQSANTEIDSLAFLYK